MTYEEDDRVLAEVEGEIYAGTIVRCDSEQALIGFAIGDPMDITSSPSWWTERFPLSEILPARLAFELEGKRAQWCTVHYSGVNWQDRGPQCDAYRLLKFPGYATGVEPCKVVEARVSWERGGDETTV